MWFVWFACHPSYSTGSSVVAVLLPAAIDQLGALHTHTIAVSSLLEALLGLVRPDRLAVGAQLPTIESSLAERLFLSLASHLRRLRPQDATVWNRDDKSLTPMELETRSKLRAVRV